MRVFVSALTAGVVGTLVLSVIVHAASETGLTRMDLPFLLGTTVTENRGRAKALGYVSHFLLGMVFALPYAWLFVMIGTACCRAACTAHGATCLVPRARCTSYQCGIMC
jgi:hypothetical protein